MQSRLRWELSPKLGKSSQADRIAGVKLSNCSLGTHIAQTFRQDDAVCAVETERKGWIMKTIKMMTLATVVATLVAGFALISTAARAANQEQFDAAATFKAKCVACHGAAAEKRFDATISDADLVQFVLKGKKVEKPPNMPAYEEKGINEEQAKALVAYMKSLKK